MRLILTIVLCIQTSVHAITFNELLAQASLWQPQHCQPREDLLVEQTSKPTAPCSVAMCITLHSIHTPAEPIAKISYIKNIQTKTASPFITSLKVEPPYRRIGIASTLLGATLYALSDAGYHEAALSAQPLTSEIFYSDGYQTDLKKLVRLYERNGGRQTQLIKFPKSSGFREYPYSVLMVFDLTKDRR